MTLAISYDDVRKNQVRNEANVKGGTTGGSASTKFFTSPTIPDFPHAGISVYDPGRTSSSHFHLNDQFQVVVGGSGKLGGHQLSPYCVHFSRAYTPYGPLSADAGGLTFMAMRTHFDKGAQRLPNEMEQLKKVPDRQPWQATCKADIPELAANAQTAMQEIPGLNDKHGLAGYALKMKPNAEMDAPDPSRGDGQYLVVVKGSVWHESKEHRAFALVFVYPKDGPLHIRAGADGLEALILNFPDPKLRARTETPSAAAGFKKWQCELCAFAYDEALGMPEEGVPAGTRWQDVPDTWMCPDCGTSKADFKMVEV